MLVNCKCKKCQQTAQLDIGNKTKEEVIDCLKKQKSFQCFGHHVELTSPLDFWEIDWDSLEQGNALTEEEFVSELKKDKMIVYDTEEMKEKYDIQGFSMGMIVAIDKSSGAKLWFDFTTSPKGKRYYYCVGRG
jgi:hypothetical protein